jgi:hypothetical protein
MKLKLPSPAMVVALIALTVASSGTAIAAVSFARNAGAVDGKSAVADGASASAAAGRLVATQRKGAGKGRIAQRYLDLAGLARGTTSTFGNAIQLIDNQSLAPAAIGNVAGLGSLTATCQDENAAAGRLDPATTITFANTSGDVVNFERSISYAGTATLITALPNGTTSSFKISGSQPFQMHIERRGTNYVVNGVVRQDGRNAASAQCVVYGVALTIPPSS